MTSSDGFFIFFTGKLSPRKQLDHHPFRRKHSGSQKTTLLLLFFLHSSHSLSLPLPLSESSKIAFCVDLFNLSKNITNIVFIDFTPDVVDIPSLDVKDLKFINLLL